MSRSICRSLPLALFASTLLPLAAGGVPAARAEGKHPVPAWCGDFDPFGAPGVDTATSRADARDALYGLAMIMCEPGERGGAAEDAWAALEASKAYWSKRLAMTDADWKDVPAWAEDDASARNSPVFVVDKKVGLAAFDAIEQFGLLGGHAFVDRHYYADALGGRLTALGRASYVQQCMESETVGEWAICHADVLAFDLKKAAAEIAGATGRKPSQRVAVRTQLDLIARAIPAHLKRVEELVKKDEGYAKAFALGAELHKASGEHKGEAVDVAFAMDDARLTQSRKAFADCGDRTWKVVGAAIGAIPAKTFADVYGDPDRDFVQKALALVLDDEDVFLAAGAYAICAAETDHVDYLAQAIGTRLRSFPGIRGPRTSTHSLLWASPIQLDDRDAKLALPAFTRDWYPQISGSSAVQGVVGSVERDGDTATIKFAPKMEKVKECAVWKPTNRLVAIQSDGQLLYDSVCTKTAVNTYNFAPPPEIVSVRFLEGVKKGAFISVGGGVVMAVWPKQGAALPSAVFGVAVK